MKTTWKIQPEDMKGKCGACKHWDALATELYKSGEKWLTARGHCLVRENRNQSGLLYRLRTDNKCKLYVEGYGMMRELCIGKIVLFNVERKYIRGEIIGVSDVNGQRLYHIKLGTCDKLEIFNNIKESQIVEGLKNE